MRIFKKLRDLFRKRGRLRKVSASPRVVVGNSTAPKNGRLTLAVIAVFVLMLALAALNVRLILDPSIAGKAFGPWVPLRPDAESAQPASASCPAAENKPNLAPPQVTFYSKLVAQEELPRCPEEAGSDQNKQDAQPTSAKDSAVQATKPADKHAGKKTGKHASTEPRKLDRQASAETNLPGPDSGTGTYMVQVGAFSHPGIAQQWAARWKSRGYEVILKPVARPRTGILYRLYLGKFSSQQEADALVRRLKMREGITAFRLLVRN